MQNVTSVVFLIVIIPMAATPIISARVIVINDIFAGARCESIAKKKKGNKKGGNKKKTRYRTITEQSCGNLLFICCSLNVY